jgi:hypothetical protein
MWNNRGGTARSGHARGYQIENVVASDDCSWRVNNPGHFVSNYPEAFGGPALKESEEDSRELSDRQVRSGSHPRAQAKVMDPEAG